MKKEASSSIGYLFLFALLLLGGIVAIFILVKARGMTNQREVDDTLASAVLGSLVMDDNYYFYTRELNNPTFVFRDTKESYKKYKEIITEASKKSEDFYKNLTFDSFITYEVEDGKVTVTEFNEDGTSNSKIESLGNVTTPKGEKVEKTSAYGKISFDVKGINDTNRVSRDCYCNMEGEN